MSDDPYGATDGQDGTDDAPAHDDGTGVREGIVRRFEAWLDDALQAEDPPQGVAAEILAELQPGDDAAVPHAGDDLHSLWSAMAALTQEIKIQGRTFKQLSGALDPLADTMAAAGEAHQKAAEQAQRTAQAALADREARDREIAGKAEHRAQRDAAEVLLDVRERMIRGVDMAQSHARQVREVVRPGSFRGLFGIRSKKVESVHAAAASLHDAYGLSLGVVEEALQRFGIREIHCEGQPFDPLLMKAVDVDERVDVPEGAVLEVYRPGYQWRDDVFRAAEVKVARKPPADTDAPRAGGSIWRRAARAVCRMFGSRSGSDEARDPRTADDQ